jgi:hypothetical protein
MFLMSRRYFSTLSLGGAEPGNFGFETAPSTEVAFGGNGDAGTEKPASPTTMRTPNPASQGIANPFRMNVSNEPPGISPNCGAALEANPGSLAHGRNMPNMTSMAKSSMIECRFADYCSIGFTGAPLEDSFALGNRMPELEHSQSWETQRLLRLGFPSFQVTMEL